MVDLLLCLREELMRPTSRRVMTEAMAERLSRHIDTIVRGLPDDLRASLAVGGGFAMAATPQSRSGVGDVDLGTSPLS